MGTSLQQDEGGFGGSDPATRGAEAKGRLQGPPCCRKVDGGPVGVFGCPAGAFPCKAAFHRRPLPPVSGGLSVWGSGGLALGIVLALILADSVHWAATHLQQDAADAPAQPRRPLWQPIDRGWVDRGP